jgi:ribosomal protein S12 methylthiotransferase accessory factor
MEGVGVMAPGPSDPDFQMAVTALGNLHETFGHVAATDRRAARGEHLGGGGADTDPEIAWIRAVVEGAERYALMAWTADDFIVARERDLGTDALDLGTIPRCSEREYADPRCPFRRPDPAAPIRWTRGFSLVDQRERFVPSIMTHLFLNPEPAESFWYQISTGVAAHTSLAAALVSAICEVVERDAIAITWLARLSLPRIEIERPAPGELETNLRVLGRSLVRHRLFDATTDVGVPTAYAVQLLDEHPTVSQYVSCATDFSPAAACAKTIREASPGRAVFRAARDVPADVCDFTTLHHAATYMGRPEQRSAFAFLLESPHRRSLAQLEIAAPEAPEARLRFLVDRLRALDMDAVAVDLTTDELRDVGLWVVRVVIPGLMPMSPVQRGRFLGHPRLYAYPEKAGFGRLSASDLNPAPQPFA